MTNEQYIWQKLNEAGYTEIQTAGIMGNLMLESGLRPNNLQNYFENKLNMNDQQYTDAVNSGAYTIEQFIGDGAGYGLAQWTYWTRKKALYAKCMPDIGSLEKQVAYMIGELAGFPEVQKRIHSTDTIKDAATIIMKYYEMPADQSQAAIDLRTAYGRQIYARQHKTEPKVLSQWFACQCATFNTQKQAEKWLPVLSKEYHVYSSDRYYVIALGQYETYQEASQHLPEAKKQRSDAFITVFKAAQLIK